MAKVPRASKRGLHQSIASLKPKSTSRDRGSAVAAAGYARRHARKAGLRKSSHELADDVYEYAPETLSSLRRRSRVTLSLDHDEAREHGVASDGDDDSEGANAGRTARLIGENVEGEMIESGDDEDIDSDAAFDESDEDRFAGFFSTKAKGKSHKARKLKSTPTVRFAEVDLNEDEGVSDRAYGSPSNGDGDGEEEDEDEVTGEDDEFIDVLDILDGRVNVEDTVEGSEGPSRTSHPERADLDMDENEQSDDDDKDEQDQQFEEESVDYGESDATSLVEEENEDILPSEDETAPEALDKLRNFISGLETASSQKRKAPPNESQTDTERIRRRKQRRIALEERTEAGAENEFYAPASNKKLALDDLLGPLSSTANSASFRSLKKSTKALAPSSTKIQTLPAPLPQRAQERVDREAAYEKTKEEVDKWSETMKRIREAEHLSFPLQPQKTMGRVSNLELAAKFKPTTDLETSVFALLKLAKLRDEDVPDTESAMLAANKVSVEEVADRRAELRKMRELMFRAEIKARRVKKIKSKTYRRIQRKQKMKLGGEGEGEDGKGEMDEEDRKERDVGRARERATLRHKHTGKWAREMKSRGMYDEDGDDGGAGTRREIEEMLSRGEKLRQRIRGVGSESESEEEEESEDDGDHDGVDNIKRDAFEELRAVNDDEEGMEDGAEMKKGKSIFGMKFMKDAMARQQAETDRMVDDFVKEMGGDGEGIGAEDDEEAATPSQEMNGQSHVVVQKTGGRMSYHPGAPTSKRKRQPSVPMTSVDPLQAIAHAPIANSDTSSVTLKSTDFLSPPPASPLSDRRAHDSLPFSNPWLIPAPESSTASKVPKKHNEVVAGKDSSGQTKSRNKLRKVARKQEQEKEKRRMDAVVEIEVGKVLMLPSDGSGSAIGPSTTVSEGAIVKQKAVVNLAIQDDEDDAITEIEQQELALEMQRKGKRTGGVKAFEQRELVALAFAGDNVVQQFEEAKKREIAADAPKEVNTTLPGWGSWGGAGIRKAPPKPQYVKKIAGIDPTTRADYGKAHVIISEKRDKKAAKYMVKDLPYPYTSKAQFERTMETPLGSEWNTRVAFQRGTLPRVVKKPGVIINALEKVV